MTSKSPGQHSFVIIVQRSSLIEDLGLSPGDEAALAESGPEDAVESLSDHRMVVVEAVEARLSVQMTRGESARARAQLEKLSTVPTSSSADISGSGGVGS